MRTYPLRFELRITPELRDALEHAAAQQDRSFAWIIRDALKQYIRDHDPDQAAA